MLHRLNFIQLVYKIMVVKAVEIKLHGTEERHGNYASETIKIEVSKQDSGKRD